MKYKLFPVNKIIEEQARNNEIFLVVSLTTFPKRIGTIWLVVETVFRQSVTPNKIILWLSDDQFPNGEEDLPKRLLKYIKYGLEIRFKKGDIRSHKKYYYAMMEFPEAMIITLDDDVYYPKNTIEVLLSTANKFPGTIVLNRGWEPKFQDGKLLSYKKWKMLTGERAPSFKNFLTGIFGVLYPPGSLHREYKEADVFMEQCRLADDVWLYAMALLNNTKLTKTSADFLMIPVKIKEDITLTSQNVANNLNDVQLANVQTHLYEKYGFDLYSKMYSDE